MACMAFETHTPPPARPRGRTRPARDATPLERLEHTGWDVAARRPDMGDCWLWRGGVSPEGTPRVTLPVRRKAPAHRVAWEALKGPLPAGTYLIPACGERLCIRPEHMELQAPRGRRPSPSARARMAAGAGILTEGQVRAIRALPVPPTREGRAAHYRTLAARHDVSEMTVYRVVQGRTWKHLLDDDAADE